MDYNARFWKGHDAYIENLRIDCMIAATKTIPMNYFDACGVFMAFLDSKPCWQSRNEVWPEV